MEQAKRKHSLFLKHFGVNGSPTVLQRRVSETGKTQIGYYQSVRRKCTIHASLVPPECNPCSLEILSEIIKPKLYSNYEVLEGHLENA